MGADYEFQFHKGTIKTCKILLYIITAVAFQFHKGTIKTVFLRQLMLHLHYFNSIKVRLKHIRRQREVTLL